MSRDYQALFPRPVEIPTPPEVRTAHSTPDRDELRWVLENAALAPSGGNFQPWKFAWDGARLRCLFDEERTHYFTNYRHCETHISLGAAVTNIEVAAQAIGLAADAVPFPEGDGANPVPSKLVKSSTTGVWSTIAFCAQARPLDTAKSAARTTTIPRRGAFMAR